MSAAADTTLRERLARYLTGPTLFELPADNDLGSPALTQLLEDYLPFDPPKYPQQRTLRIADPSAMSGDDPVTFSGMARIVRDQPAEIAVDVAFATVAGVVQVGIASKPLPVTWGFADAFASLAGTALAAVRYTSARLALASSDAEATGGLPRGLSFRGVPDRSGPLAAVDWLFASTPTISGAITLGTAGPLIDVAGSLTEPASLGPLKLLPGIRLSTAAGPPGSPAVFARAEATGTLSIGPAQAQVGVLLSTAERSLLELSLGSPVKLDSYTQLDALADGTVDFAGAVVGVPGSQGLTLDGLTLIVSRGSQPVLTSIGVQVSLTPETAWPLLPGGILTAKRLRVAFALLRPMQKPALRVQVFGRFGMELGAEAPVDYDVVVALPELTASGQLAPGNTIELDKLVAHFLAPFVPVAGIPSLEVYELGFGVDVRNAAYQLDVGINADWTLLRISDAFAIDLIAINGSFSYAGSQVALMIDGTWRFEFAPGQAGGSLDFDAIAAKSAGEAGWDFRLEQTPGSALDLIVVVQHFVGADVSLPDILPDTLKIKNVAIGLNTATKAYSIEGQAAAVWTLKFADTELEVEAHLAVTSTPGDALLGATSLGLPPPPYAMVRRDAAKLPARTTAGSIGGALTIGRFRATVEYQFGSASDVLLFSFAFGDVTVSCTRTIEQGDVILRGGVRGVSLGSMLDWLVDLVEPGLGFRLPAPWDVLYEVSFDTLTIEVNLTKGSVGFLYPVKLTTGFIDVTSLGLTYGPNPFGRKSVFVEIVGSFLGRPFTSDDPLNWDLLNDPPPATTGKGDSLVDVRYLAIGQNVGFRDGRAFDSVGEVVAALRKDFLAPSSGSENPLAPSNAPALAFTGDGRWLIAADFTIMGAVRLSGVFADPVLYGVRIGLSGEKVEQLAGLEFEIFYKKITPSVGVYQLELTLPAAFRQLQFGAVSLTLPVVGIDIYTNGNFRVDLGFPAGGDFTRSFCVQGGPFVGYGGVYFAVLDGSTSRRVPQITNGNFSPVVEFGVGLSLGLGRSIDKGVLKAGLTLTVEAIMEGAIAWFNPDDRSLPTTTFYHVEGTAAIVGKVYGSVDFGIVKAEVNIVARASVTLVIESYKAIEVALSLSVRVSVSVKVLFITIDFSFGTKLDLSFEIGSASTPPWQLAAPDHEADVFALRQQRTLHHVRRVPPARVLGELLAAAGGAAIDPQPVRVFDTVQPVVTQLVPAFTVASPPAGSHTLASAPAAAAVQVVVGLYIGTGEDVATTGPRRERAAAAAGAPDAPFNLLARGMLRWALSWTSEQPLDRGADEVGVEQLDALADWLADPLNRRRAFAWENLSAFIGENYKLHVTVPELERGDVAAAQTPVAGAIFPMPPVLQMAAKGRAPVRYWEQRCVGPDYEDRLSAYFDQLRIDTSTGTGEPSPSPPPSDVAAGPRGLGGPRTADSGCTGDETSLPTHVFSDYFAIVAKGAVQAARELYDAYPYKARANDTLAGVLAEFTNDTLEHRIGDNQTLATIAARYGIGVGELRAANPHVTAGHPHERLMAGLVVRVPAGPTLTTLAEANADYPLRRPSGYVPVAGVKHQVTAPTGGSAATQSIADVSRTYAAYGAPGPSGLFAGSAAGDANAANPSLLAAGVGMTVPPSTYLVTSGDMLGGDALDRVAARLFTRAGGWTGGQYSPWYRQRILDLNDGPSGSPPPEATVLKVPVAKVTDNGIEETATSNYALVAGDDVDLVARYFELIQLAANTAPGFTGLRGSIGYTPPIAAGTPLGLPTYDYEVQAGDSLAAIAARTGVGVGRLADANAGSRSLLRNLAVVLLPGLTYLAQAGDTLATVAEHFDLTIGELAEGAKGATMLAPFGATAPYGATVGPMTVPHVSGRDRDKLEASLVEEHRLGELAGAVSRFLLHGMRVPAPDAIGDDPPLGPLYEALGQQFPGPTAGQAPYDIAFSKGPSADWLCLAPTGVTCPTGLTMRLGPSFIKNHQPSTTLDPHVIAGPSAMPFARAVAPHHGLQQGTHWQAGTPVMLPGPTTQLMLAGQPSLWQFPESLLTTLASATGPTGPYELMSAPSNAILSGGETPADPYAWGTAVPIRISRVPGPDGAPLPNGYLVGGADPAGRELLLAAWRSRAPDPGDRLYVLYPPAQAGPNPGGLVSRAVDAQRTFVLRTNLSTVTSSNVGVLAAGVADAGRNHALVSSPNAFLGLMWQASVTGSGGFYLGYADAAGGGLPGELFAGGGEATIWLLFVRAGQTGGAGRTLLAFDNCAVLGANVDRATRTLFARLRAPTPAQLRSVAAVPVGTVGFQLTRTNPGLGPTGATLTQGLYNLLGFRVQDGADFRASHEGLPVGPLSSSEDDFGADTPVGPTDPWRYQQLLPIARFGRVNDAPRSSALPGPQANPYAGITGPTGASGANRPLSQASLELAFQDLYGNRTPASPPLAALDVPVGYIDDVIAVSAWPGAGFAYELRTDAAREGAVLLAAVLSLHSDRYVAGAGLPFAQANRAARNDAARYERIFFQVHQRDLGFALESNIGTAAIDRGELKAALTAFVTKAKLLADATSALVEVSAAITAGTALGDVAATYAVTCGQLFVVNAQRPLDALVAGSLVVPRLVAVGPGNTLAALGASARQTPWPPVCAVGENAPPRPALSRVASDAPLPPPASPADEQSLSPTALAERNVDTPLGMGTTLRTKARVTATPSVWGAPPNTVAAVAAWLACPVYARVDDPVAGAGATIEIGLLADNLDATGLVAPQLRIEIGAVTVTTEASSTLRTLLAAFAAVTPDLASFASAIAEVDGIFQAAQPLRHASFIVPTPPAVAAAAPVASFTLAQMPADSGTVAELAVLNSVVPSFFAPGVAVYLDFTCAAPGPGDTLASLAAAHLVTLDDLGRYNADTPLAATTLTIGQLTTLASAAQPFTAYVPAAADTLAGVAGLFGLSAVAVADLNRELAGVLRSGATVLVGGRSYAVAPLETLGALLERCRRDDATLTWETFVAAVAPQPETLSPSGAIVTPLPTVPAGEAVTLREIATRFGLERGGGDDDAPPAVAELRAVESLLAMNRSLEGFLRDGSSIAGPSGVAIAVGAHDTVETVIRRMHEDAGVTVSVADLANANAGAANLLTVGRRFLLPVVPTALRCGFAPQVPPLGASGEDEMIFPVRIEVRLTRAKTLVSPELAAAPSVQTASSRLTPLTVAGAEAGAGLRTFALRFEEAFVPWLLKCAVSKSHTPGASEPDGQIWAVSFGPAGLSQVRVGSASPSYYAMAPLATSLQTANVLYFPYTSGCGLGAPLVKRFESVDLDAWLRSFLDTVDLYLSTPYAVSGFEQQPSGPRGMPLTPSQGPAMSSLPGASGCEGCTGPTGPPSGPADFERVVDAKERIADSLSARVVGILDGIGSADTLAAARETLRQQLRVKLSAAYEIDAVLEFPVTVESPWTRGATGLPARISGPVVPRLVAASGGGTAGALATLADIAAKAGVSTPFLGALVRERRGLLATGATVTYGTAGHTILADDTLASIAAALGVAVDFSKPADWAAWVDFVDGGQVGTQAIVPAAAGFPVTAISRAIEQRDSLGLFARFAGTDVASVGRANQGVPGVFVTGSQISVGSQTHTVAAGDTIWSIAKALGTGVTVDAVAEAVRDRTGLLAVASLGFAALLPDATLSTAKVAAGPIGSMPPGLSVLLTLGDRARERNVFFDLDYVVNELEYSIRPVPGVSGYQASSWLSFPLPIGATEGARVPVQTSIEQIQVPVPVRSYPDVPILTEQLGTPSLPGATGIDGAKLWDYAFDFERRAAAQDATRVEVTFEHEPAGLLAAAAHVASLLSPLATFNEALSDLTADLARLTSAGEDGQSYAGARAGQVLSCLCEWMADALESAGRASLGAGASPTYEYRMQAAGFPDLRDLSLINATGPSGATWPSVWLRSTTGWSGGSEPNAGYVELTPGARAGATAAYAYPPDVPANARLTHRFAFDERDVIQDTRGYGGVWLTRNDGLIAAGPLGATGDGRGYATNDAFVYQTPRVRFGDPLVPTLTNTTGIDVAALSGGERLMLQAHLDALLERMFGLPAGDGWIQLTCAYAYPAAGPDADLWVTVPIRLLPTTRVTAAAATALAASVAASVQDWRRTADALRDDARLTFDVTAFTPAGASGDGLKPILELSNLFLDVAKINFAAGAEDDTMTDHDDETSNGG